MSLEAPSPLKPQATRGKSRRFLWWPLQVFILAVVAKLLALFMDFSDLYEKGFALYHILTLSNEDYEKFLDSYDVYMYATDAELEDAYGADWRSVEMQKHKHTYTVIQYYCALVSCQKMYIAPLFNTGRGNEENQVIFEYQLAHWLKKGTWEDKPFSAGWHRHEVDEPVKTSKVLEVGCGQGRILQELGRFLGSNWELMGMNLDGNQLRHAKERPVKVQMRDMNLMPYEWIEDHSLDGAYNLGAVTFQRDLEEHARELARILKPGSRFVVACDWTSFEKSSNGLDLDLSEHRKLWGGARRLGAAGRYCYTERDYVSAFTKHGFRHVHSEVYGHRYVQALRDVDKLRLRAAWWMKTFAKIDFFGFMEKAVTMMERFGSDVEASLEAHDRKLFTYCGSHVFELQGSPAPAATVF